MAPDEHKALVRRFVDEVWNRGNLAVADELLSPAEAGPVKERVIQVRTEVPDVEITIEEIVAEGDLVVTFETVRGHHRPAPARSSAAASDSAGHTRSSTRPIAMARAVFYRVAAGKLTVVRRLGDNRDLFPPRHAGGPAGQTGGRSEETAPAE